MLLHIILQLRFVLKSSDYFPCLFQNISKTSASHKVCQPRVRLQKLQSADCPIHLPLQQTLNEVFWAGLFVTGSYLRRVKDAASDLEKHLFQAE